MRPDRWLAICLLCACLLWAGCASQPPASPAGPHAPAACIADGVIIPLLGGPGDSPLVPVTIRGRPAAMFFSPGFGPSVMRANGFFSFRHLHYASLQTQDGGKLDAWLTVVPQMAIGTLPPQDETAITLRTPLAGSVDGRPIVGIIGRTSIAPNAVVDLDMVRRQVAMAVLSTPRCAGYTQLLPGQPLAMQQEMLLVPVRVNGHPVEAVLEPDVPVSVIPSAMAASLGIAAGNGPSVRTLYGTRVRGIRRTVSSLMLGGSDLRDLQFDVEDGPDYVMLGLNFFERGEAVFDFERNQFWFHVITDRASPPGVLHYDETKVAHTAVEEEPPGAGH